MKRLFLGFWVLLATLLIGTTPANALSTNNFSISNYDIAYDLSQDSDARSVLKTTEIITVKFPNFDQNHGIERAIPKSYDGHSTSLTIDSITNKNGSDLEYSTYTNNGNEVLRIGNADTYVRGEQTYKITYTQRDVTKAFNNAGDEFYWDTNGTEWQVPINKLTVTLRLSDQIADKLNGSTACYQGVSESTDMCKLIQDGNVFTTQAANLDSGQNISVAVGFNENSFAAYEASLWEKILQIYIVVSIIIGSLAIAVIVFIITRYANWSMRKRDIGTIIPEYIPPSGTSVSTSASLLTATGSVFTAQLLDFAVRHYIKLYQTTEKTLFKPADYDIELVKDISTLSDEEQEILNDIYSGTPKTGQRIAMSSLRDNTSVSTSMLDNAKKLKALVRGDYGLRARNDQQTTWFTKFGWLLLVFAFITINPIVLIASLASFLSAYLLWPLTDKGVELYRYLEGLKLYIKVAEKERLTMLQSPEGAQKVGSIDPSQPGELVKLYERVLPYAVLFGQEKQWSKQIGELYQSAQSSPSWYSGNAAFNAAVFGSMMSGFSAASSYAAATSSSSSGSSGGGSSGGGGGGGGGGGW